MDEGVDGGVESVPESVDTGSDGGVSEGGGSDSGDWDGWDGWDGVVDTLPENLRDTGFRIHDRLSSDFGAREQEYKEIADVYNAVIREHEDPRVNQLTESQAALQQEYDAYKAEKGPVAEQYEGLQTEYTQYQQMVARDYADRFWERHADLRDDASRRQKFVEFLDPEGPHGEWDAEMAVELLDLPEDILKLAVEAKQDGVSDKYALRLAKAELRERELTGELEQKGQAKRHRAEERAQMEALVARKEASRPRPAAQITNGATTDTRPEVRNRTISDARSLDEQRMFAARRALRVHPGGK